MKYIVYSVWRGNTLLFNDYCEDIEFPNIVKCQNNRGYIVKFLDNKNKRHIVSPLNKNIQFSLFDD